MGKAVSKATNEVKLNVKNKRSTRYRNLDRRTKNDEDENGINSETKINESKKGNNNNNNHKNRKMDALMHMRKRPVSAFIQSGTDGLYVWFVSTWMRLKQKHYGKFKNDNDSSGSFSSHSPPRTYSFEHIEQPILHTIERTNSTESNDLNLADISDSVTDSGRSSSASQDETHVGECDLYAIKYFNETVNDFESKKCDAVQPAGHVRKAQGSRNHSFSLNDEY